MLELPSFEKKIISDGEVVEALRAGVDDPKVHQFLEDWSRQEEEKGIDFVSSIEVNMRRGRIYIQAGYVEEGLEALEAAFDEAWYGHEEDLANKIRTEIDSLILE